MAQKIALLGFGVVGQGLVEIIRDKGASLQSELGFGAKIVAIADLMKGSIYHPEGLDLDEALRAVKETGKLDSYPETPGLIRNWDSFQTIRESNADTIVEITFTDVKTGQPAIDHCRAAFESGKNVVMSNKGPVALAYQELSQLAKKQGVRWGFEGTVMSGTPALRMPITTLAGNDIEGIVGILNGTTNYILTKCPMRAFAITGIETAFTTSSTIVGSAIRATPPAARISDGTRSKAMTATAPAASAILACSALTTSMMTPPFCISAMPRFTIIVPTSIISLFLLMSRRRNRCSSYLSSLLFFYLGNLKQTTFGSVISWIAN